MPHPVLEMKQRPGFRDLMKFRVHEILLVSSLYDAFKLEEDGRLGEMIFTDYQDMNLTNAPRVTRVSTADHAMRQLDSTHYDLVITLTRISDMNPFKLGKRIKKQNPDLPVIMLAANQREYAWAMQRTEDFGGIDRIFIWLGDSSIFTAIIKYIEDHMNAPRDILRGGARAIIVVEDSPKFYSMFIPLLYKLIISTTQRLMRTEYTDQLRMVRMRSRPKILLATTYEEARELFEAYQNNLLAVITDVRYPREGTIDPEAGAKFLAQVSAKNPTMPMMLQSMERKNIHLASDLGAYFLDKSSPNLLQSLHDFVLRHCGFGDLIFATSEGDIIARVKHLRALETALQSVPIQSIKYHAQRDHFSNWLAVRGYFDLADVLKPLLYNDFDDPEEFREVVISMVAKQRRSQYFGNVGYFNVETYDPEIKSVRFGGGSMGGKARGLAFLDAHLRRFNFSKRYGGIQVRVPNFAVIGTDIFDRFVAQNDLLQAALEAPDNDAVDELFREGFFPGDFTEQLHAYLGNHANPLAVRSSSLLEDSLFQPFAGIYSTYMLPNCAPALDDRVHHLLEALKLVYASIFHKEAIAYMQSTGNRPEEEKMAVVIQHLSGQRHGKHYYPAFSGVVQSVNYYPQSGMRREEGLATVALGLGRTVVNGERALKFNPARPTVLPQFFDSHSIMNNSQSHFYALEMTRCDEVLKGGEGCNLDRLTLEDAEKHGTLDLVGSVYSPVDGTFRENLFEKGPRVVTFANVLKWKVIPLADMLRDLMELGKIGMGCDVEMEFALDHKPDSENPPEISVLQIRPMVTFERPHLVDLDEIDPDDRLVKSEICLGNGDDLEIRDIVYIKIQDFDISKTRQMATDLKQLNDKLQQAGRPYLLIGPGRWGTADPLMGIPVQWNHINHARSIVELGLPDLYVEPSFGSHFFQNITSLGISYFTIPPKHLERDLNRTWLEAQTPHLETPYINHLRFEQGLTIQVDGTKGRGVILRPGIYQTDGTRDPNGG